MGQLTSSLPTESNDYARFTAIVKLVSQFDDEDELVEAACEQLRSMSLAHSVVIRRLNDDGTLLVANTRPPGDSDELRTHLHAATTPVDGSWEGYSLRNARMLSIPEDIPDEPLGEAYVADALRAAELGAYSGAFIPMQGTGSIGILAVYGVVDQPFDVGRIDLLTRAATVLAFGIEKCRVQSELRTQRGELAAANERLAASNRDLQDFAYVASHDLQEPLRKIQAFGDRLAQKAGDRLNDDQLTNLTKMRVSSNQMQHLIHDLLRYSRVGSAALITETVDLNDVVQQVLPSLSASISRCDGAITVAPEIPAVVGDPAQFGQVLTILLENALQYRSADRQCVIDISWSEKADEVSLSITDNGIGFDERHAARIFEPFKRLHSNADYAGAGIGLAICERIMDRHESSISASSVVGEGSTFTLTMRSA